MYGALKEYLEYVTPHMQNSDEKMKLIQKKTYLFEDGHNRHNRGGCRNNRVQNVGHITLAIFGQAIEILDWLVS